MPSSFTSRHSEHTELSVWSAPITAGGGTRPTITARPTSAADVGVAVLEYSGLSTASRISAMDVHAQASGTTSVSGAVASGPTPATTAANELALGAYVDSGFGDTLGGGSGFTVRTNVSKASDMEFVDEDAVVGSGATPNAGFATGANTVWLAATVVFKNGSAPAPTAPGAPTSVTASPGDGAATVSWTAPSDGGSQITSYTITPHVGTAAQPATTVVGSPPATSAAVAGLVDGTTCSFTVAATNAVGTGPASSASNPVTPSATANGQWGPLLTWPIVAVHRSFWTVGSCCSGTGGRPRSRRRSTILRPAPSRPSQRRPASSARATQSCRMVGSWWRAAME